MRIFLSLTLAALHAPIGFHGSGPGSPRQMLAPQGSVRAVLELRANDSKLNSCSTYWPKRAHSDAGRTFAPWKLTWIEPEARSRDGRSLLRKDDLQTLPLAEVEKKLGSSPDGLTQSRGAKAADPIWAK